MTSKFDARFKTLGEIDLLINNAGIAVFGSQEETDLDKIRDLFEVNVFGPIRVTKALLPSLRRNQGTIVQLSSVAGRTVFPESGFYAATKYAIEAMSEALFQETSTFGIRLRLIEPGAFATRFQEHAQEASPPRVDDSPYADLWDLWDQRKNETLEPPQNPDLVVEAIIASLADPRPWLRVPVGADAERILALRDTLGADPWSTFAAERNGLTVSTHEDGQVRSALEVVSLWGKRRKNAKWKKAEQADLQPTVSAVKLKHLDHWNDSENGRQALALLAPLLTD